MSEPGPPLAVFGDTQAEAVTELRALLAGRDETYAAGVQVGSKVPGDRSTDIPHLPYVVARHDVTTEVVYPIVARGTLRVTVWHEDEDQAFDLANLCHGLLLKHSGDVLIGCAPLTGPVRAVDPDTGVDLASFTVRASVRGTVVPS